MKNNIVFVNGNDKYSLKIDMALERGKREIFDWFKQEGIDIKINVYVYEDSLTLKEGIKKRVNKSVSNNLMSYTILESKDKNISRSLNIIEPKNCKIKEYNHLLYRELVIYIIDYLYGNLPSWVINGIINNMDVTYRDINTDYLLLRVSSSLIPKIDNLLLSPKYNEYTYLIIKYIIDFYGKDYLLHMLEEEGHFTLHGQDYLDKALLFFSTELNKIS